ncbi:hypothetical protein RCG19_03430 [Neobacillus sp. OS1-2]|uniref:hypothetical protein n=1 Tax=Neobacillus sp. OS1-2 TaxID=3070680 RepID=UPI0027DFF86F|nr:hypothetical protein [Neobacillus sp. OS1-2]WML40756.1 hypothetical protein RCG19_03430 [Neobacillus sp. OS1-2]
MMDYKQVIERLEKQNMNPDTTEAQREANNFRISWLKMIHREKPSKTKTVFYDAVQQRLVHGNSVTPNGLLND